MVRAIHVRHDEVRHHLAKAANFMSRFSTVVSLNYDVLVYWAMLAGNEKAPNRFKDCFVRGEFQENWDELRKPYGTNDSATLVFYPHGNLALAADLAGAEFKIHVNSGTALLETVFTKWRAGDTIPAFVSEGTSEQKRMAIRRSPYLTTEYEEVLPALGDRVVVFGWSISDTDDHLLDAICLGAARRFGVAVDPVAGRLGEFEAVVHRKLAERLGRNGFELTFFDRGSKNCWITP